MEFSEFLLARIAEDEARATAAVHGVPEFGRWETRDREITGPDRDGMVIYDEGGHSEAQAQHIAAWDPARVLAECGLKRRILSLALARHPFAVSNPECPSCYQALALAQVYADHADFDPAWALS